MTVYVMRWFPPATFVSAGSKETDVPVAATSVRGDHTCLWRASETVKVMDPVAAACVAVTAASARSTQVPALEKESTGTVGSTNEQPALPASVTAYVIAPGPELTAGTSIIGLASALTGVDGDHEMVCDSSSMAKVCVCEPAAWVDVPPAVADTWHDPAPVKASCGTAGSAMEHPEPPALTTAYVIAPGPSLAAGVTVTGLLAASSLAGGDQEIACAAGVTVKDRDTGEAARWFTSPGWSAMRVHVPAACMVTTPLSTVQIDEELLVTTTSRSESAVAVTTNVEAE